jgi:hypothetical protein
VYTSCRRPILGSDDDTVKFRRVVSDFVQGVIPVSLGDGRVVSGFTVDQISANDVPSEILAALTSGRFVLPTDAWLSVRCISQRAVSAAVETATDWAPTDDELLALEESMLGDHLLKWTSDAFFAMSLAAPGSIQMLGATIAGVATAHRTAESQYPLLHRTRSGSELPAEWPVVREIPLEDVWRWLAGLPRWNEGFTASPVTRAVQALYYLTTRTDVAVELLWVMVGLESLFTDGESGLLQQLKEKSQLFLRADSRAAKRINSMYKTRSKFVHGKLDFSGPHHFEDATADFSRFHGEMSEATALGRRMLVASIQELIVREWHDLSFRTSLIPPGCPA